MRNKRILSGILLLALLTSLIGACGNKPVVTTYSPRQIAEAVLSSQEDVPVLHPLTPEDDYYAEYLGNIYEIDGARPEDGMIYYSFGMTADEVAVFLLEETADVNIVKDALAGYKDRRASIFSGYAPFQSAIADNGLVVAHGNYVALLICKDAKTAESVFLACFSDDPPKITYNYETMMQAPPGGQADGNEGSANDPGASQNAGEGAGTEANPGTSPGTSPETSPGTNPETSPGTSPSTSPGASPGPEDGAGAAAGGGPETSASSGPGDGAGGSTAPPSTSDPSASEKPPEPTSPTSPTSPATPVTPATPESPAVTTEPGQKPDPADAYDHAAILKAWKSGDASKLSGKNKSILDACAGVIRSLITSKMSDYEKELAIHDWIIDWASYDEESLSNAPDANPDPDNDNPYGLLINKTAICRGFTCTFQLFMDMLGVECIIVEGASGYKRDEHAWNMVRIDGEWYCVDVTWNNPIGQGVAFGSEITHKYFNVTSQFMRDTGHHWDSGSVPEATAPKLYHG